MLLPFEYAAPAQVDEDLHQFKIALSSPFSLVWMPNWLEIHRFTPSFLVDTN
jgi:hypothetical protein